MKDNKTYCSSCLALNGIQVEGVKLSIKDKIISAIKEPIMVDPAPVVPGKMLALVFKAVYRCPKCGWRWVE